MELLSAFSFDAIVLSALTCIVLHELVDVAAPNLLRARRDR